MLWVLTLLCQARREQIYGPMLGKLKDFPGTYPEKKNDVESRDSETDPKIMILSLTSDID